MKTEIRQVLADHARLAVPVADLADSDDLYAAGMTSHASIGVMLGLEEAFDVEFPDRLLTRGVFASIEAIAQALAEVALEPSR